MFVKGGVVANCRCCNAIISHDQSAPDSANDAATSDTTPKNIPGPETQPNRQLPLLTKLLATTHAAAHTADRSCCHPRATNWALSSPLVKHALLVTRAYNHAPSNVAVLSGVVRFSEETATFHVLQPESLTHDPFARTRQSFVSWSRPTGTGSRNPAIRCFT